MELVKGKSYTMRESGIYVTIIDIIEQAFFYTHAIIAIKNKYTGYLVESRPYVLKHEMIKDWVEFEYEA